MWASRLTSTGARKYVSLLFMNLMASDALETAFGPHPAFGLMMKVNATTDTVRWPRFCNMKP